MKSKSTSIQPTKIISTMNSRNNSKSASPVKSCKFCKDAGKSEEEYTSHFLRVSRDPNSRITCPTLLAIECRFCFKRGHTVSKCTKLANHKNGQAMMLQAAPMKKPLDGDKQRYAINQFELISEFDDEEEADSLDESMTTCADTIMTGSSAGTLTYAEMLAKPSPVENKVEVGSRLSIMTKSRMMRSWADSDSDEE